MATKSQKHNKKAIKDFEYDPKKYFDATEIEHYKLEPVKINKNDIGIINPDIDGYTVKLKHGKTIRYKKSKDFDNFWEKVISLTEIKANLLQAGLNKEYIKINSII